MMVPVSGVIRLCPVGVGVSVSVRMSVYVLPVLPGLLLRTCPPIRVVAGRVAVGEWRVKNSEGEEEEEEDELGV